MSPRTTQTVRTLPSRSVTAITLFGEILAARVTAFAIIFFTFAAASWAEAGEARKAAAIKISHGRNLMRRGVACLTAAYDKKYVRRFSAISCVSLQSSNTFP